MTKMKFTAMLVGIKSGTHLADSNIHQGYKAANLLSNATNQVMGTPVLKEFDFDGIVKQSVENAVKLQKRKDIIGWGIVCIVAIGGIGYGIHERNKRKKLERALADAPNDSNSNSVEISAEEFQSQVTVETYEESQVPSTDIVYVPDFSISTSTYNFLRARYINNQIENRLIDYILQNCVVEEDSSDQIPANLSSLLSQDIPYACLSTSALRAELCSGKWCSPHPMLVSADHIIANEANNIEKEDE